MAWIPEAELQRIVEAKGLPAFTPHTITEFEALREELRVVRRLGFDSLKPYQRCSASGKAILAWIPEAELQRIVEAKGLPAFTPHTITEFEALREELRVVRRLGFAIDREEFQLGVL